MNTETKALLIVGIITIALLIGGVFFLSSKQPSGATQTDNGTVYQIDYSHGQKIGTDSAKVKLVEFGDLRCPACAAYEQAVEQVRKMPDVQLFYRDIAFLGPASVVAGNAAECAGEQGKFWEFHDWLYKNQPDETDTSMYNTPKMTETAVSLGLNGDQFKACLDANKYQSHIDTDRADADAFGVNSTPTFFLNGKRLTISGPNDLINAVNAQLQK